MLKGAWGMGDGCEEPVGYANVSSITVELLGLALAFDCTTKLALVGRISDFQH